MSKKFTVSAYNLNTASINDYPHKESSIKKEQFNDKTKALKFAAINKDRYTIVTVKDQMDKVIVKYHAGKLV